MNEITEITPQIKDKRRCNVYIDGRFCCGLTLETAVKYRLKVGEVISPERLSEIQLESEKNVALDKALTHISASKKTEKQVRDFLSGKGYLPAVCDYVLEKMRGYGFVDDKDYAKDYVQFSASKKGGKLIKMELKAKGVGEDEIDAALDGLEAEQQFQAARRILEKYMRGKTADRETLAKAYRHVMSKGFDYDTAKSALTSLFDTDDE
ncbi:MAG: RecX family transcriptional regulator [Clostridia bacterium]|nr:RecX family transcriptional regulator [Clostridia bacterium]